MAPVESRRSVMTERSARVERIAAADLEVLLGIGENPAGVQSVATREQLEPPY
jgi:hypothetical protein